MKRVHEQSDSSEDEIPVNILNEAIDKQFLNDNLYIAKECKTISQSELETNKLKSLRSSKQEDKFTNFGVSATFQSFVAKKLDEVLEGTIKLKNSKTTKICMKQKEERHKDSGIKLLSTSKEFLTASEIEVRTKHKEKPKICQEIEEDDDALSKFREVAVNAEYILNKSNTEAWTNKRPEPEFKYKRLKDGTLIEI